MEEVARSFAAHRLTPCRRQLTLQLFLRDGPFWHAVQTVRDRWTIIPKVKIPTEADRIPYPPVCPDSPSLLAQPDDAEPYDWTRAAQCWQEDVEFSLLRALPRRCRLPQTLWESAIWYQFLAACVRFDPPESQLIAFAEHALPMDESDVEAMAVPDDRDAAGTLLIVTPTISISEVDRSSAFHQRYQRLLLDELHQHLAPSGVDLKALAREVRTDPAFLERILARKREPDHSQAQIILTAHTTEDEIRDAWQRLQPWFKASRRGRPPIDELVAVQMAIWKERGVTQKEIAGRLGLTLQSESTGTRERSTTVRNGIKRGKEILSRRINSAE